MSYESFICRNRPPDPPSRMALQGLTAILARLREPPGTSHHHILLKRTKAAIKDVHIKSLRGSEGSRRLLWVSEHHTL